MSKRKRSSDDDSSELPAKRPLSELTHLAMSKLLVANSPMLAAHILEKKIDGSKLQIAINSDGGKLKETVKKAYLSAAAKKKDPQKAQAVTKKAVLSSAEAAAEKEIANLKTYIAANASTTQVDSSDSEVSAAQASTRKSYGCRCVAASILLSLVVVLASILCTNSGPQLVRNHQFYREINLSLPTEMRWESALPVAAEKMSALTAFCSNLKETVGIYIDASFKPVLISSIPTSVELGSAEQEYSLSESDYDSSVDDEHSRRVPEKNLNIKANAGLNTGAIKKEEEETADSNSLTNQTEQQAGANVETRAFMRIVSNLFSKVQAKSRYWFSFEMEGTLHDNSVAVDSFTNAPKDAKVRDTDIENIQENTIGEGSIDISEIQVVKETMEKKETITKANDIEEHKRAVEAARLQAEKEAKEKAAAAAAAAAEEGRRRVGVAAKAVKDESESRWATSDEAEAEPDLEDLADLGWLSDEEAEEEPSHPDDF